jgi:hypothetical protein
MSSRQERRTNIWPQIGVSACVLLLPPIVAIAVLAPHSPRPEAGHAPGASARAKGVPSVPLPITEGSFSPPGRSLQQPVADPTRFEDRFVAAFDVAGENSSQLPPSSEEQFVLPSRLSVAGPPPLATPDARLYHRLFRNAENRDIASHHAHRIAKPRHTLSPHDYSQRPTRSTAR